MTNEQVEAAALQLPQEERARLAQRLIASLDGNETIEEAWYDEAEWRLEAIRSGQLREIPADEVFEELGLEPTYWEGRI